ncbi:tetratricopeptide repeat protein [Pontibacter sp. G13]|uniref:tetratricopeptide repeat protein n=1 Tax=Pontibacter sp. G13 TaxID=3074898 RepID=UPI00288A1A41|nr:hypothetical protein [Pontibacter sp. G13]WNJ21445.1 hypothetical protein RJD25_13330 [Pontibacter sp. G13]
MDVRKIPHLTLQFFLSSYQKSTRLLFLLGMVVLLGMTFSSWLGFEQPYKGIMEIKPVTQYNQEDIQISTIENQYRTFPLSMEAYKPWTRYSATPMERPVIPQIAAWIGILFGMALMLAAGTHSQSYWMYISWGIFAALMYFTHFGSYLVDSTIGAYLIDLVAVLVPIGFAFLLQSQRIKMSMIWQFVCFFGWLLVLQAVCGWQGDPVLNVMEAFNRSYHLGFVVCIISLLFIAKEPTNLVIWGTTNHRDIKTRLIAPGILVILGLLMILEIFWVGEFMDIGIFEEISVGIRPYHLIVLGLIFTVFTSQNQFNQAKHIFQSNVSYTFTILALAIWTSCFLMAHLNGGDVVFIYLIERLAAIAFFAIGAAHIFFIISNHWPLLKNRINLYYIMGYGRKVSFMIVWLVGLCAWVFAEGLDGWKTIYLLQHTYYCNQADAAEYAGNRELAISQYSNAKLFSPFSPKANYHLATYSLTNDDRGKQAIREYQFADSVFSFPPAAINAANLIEATKNQEASKRYLERSIQKNPHSSELMASLGTWYALYGEPDHAVENYRQALLLDDKLTGGYVNLSRVYLENGKLDEAQEFLKLGLESAPNSRSLETYRRFAQLAYDWELPEPQGVWEGPMEGPEKYNEELYKIKTGQFNALETQELLKVQPTLSVMLLDAYRQFQQDSLLLAKSRIDYLISTSDEAKREAGNLLGLLYAKRGVPEMAQYYFEQQAEGGDPYGSLYAAWMLLDQRKLDTASVRLTMLRGEQESLFEECSKELSMLLLAYHEPVFAMMEYDPAKLTLDDRMRVGIYADSLGQFSHALEAFREVIALDSSTASPYVEMSRIYNRYGDPMATSNAQYGLERFPDDVNLKLELAQSFLAQGKSASFDSLIQEIPESTEKKFIVAQAALAKGDTSQAILNWTQTREADPLAFGAIKELMEILVARKEWDIANALIGQAVELNTQDSELWFYYALVSKAWGMKEDAGYGALKAIELNTDPQEKQEIEDTFYDEIQSVLNQ